MGEDEYQLRSDQHLRRHRDGGGDAPEYMAHDCALLVALLRVDPEAVRRHCKVICLSYC